MGPSHFDDGVSAYSALARNRVSSVVTKFNGTPAEILLVEDNDGDALLTIDALRSGKVSNRLHRVADGEQALSFLRCEGGYKAAPRPDLILLDLNLPRMGGREFLGIIKADPDFAYIPVVVLTGSEVEEDIVKSYDLKASCYLTKPVDSSQFEAIVQDTSEFWLTIPRLPGYLSARRHTLAVATSSNRRK